MPNELRRNQQIGIVRRYFGQEVLGGILVTLLQEVFWSSPKPANHFETHFLLIAKIIPISEKTAQFN